VLIKIWIRCLTWLHKLQASLLIYGVEDITPSLYMANIWYSCDIFKNSEWIVIHLRLHELTLDMFNNQYKINDAHGKSVSAEIR
jgi:hypothetical protein